MTVRRDKEIGRRREIGKETRSHCPECQERDQDQDQGLLPGGEPELHQDTMFLFQSSL